MTVRFLHKTEIDASRWDACVAASYNANPYGNAWFLSHVADDWHGLVLEDYQAVMPLVTAKKMGIPYIFQPPFFQRSSLFSRTEPSKELIQLFYHAIPNAFKLQEFNVDAGSSPLPEHLYEVQPRPNLILPLNVPYERMKDAYGSNTKRNLKKADKHKLEIVEAMDPSRLINAYKQNRGRIMSELKAKDYKHLETLIRHSIAVKCGQILDAFLEDKTYAGGIFILQAYNRHVLLFMGANALSKEVGAMFALIDHHLKMHSDSNIIFDFEGSSDPGVARFYSGFGATEENYFSLKINKLNKLIRFAKRYRHS